MTQQYAGNSGAGGSKAIVCLANMWGVSLIELLVGMAASAIILTAVLETFSLVHAQAVKQQQSVARQQDIRLGLEAFEQDVRLAEPGTIISASEEELAFRANINSLTTSLTAQALAGQTTLMVENGSGWGAGKTVTVCGPATCESHRLARDGQRNLLALAEPMNRSLPAGSSVEVINRISYYTRRDETGAVKLMRMVDGGANTLISDLRDVQFAYRDGAGRPTAVPADITRVVAALTPSHSSTVILHEVSLR